VLHLPEEERYLGGMGESVTSRTVRSDDFGLSEETKRVRDAEQGRLTDHAYAEAQRLLSTHRAALDRVAAALLERETLSREELVELFKGVEPDSRSSEAVGVVRALNE
jgi:ATP-dependent Zn protease